MSACLRLVIKTPSQFKHLKANQMKYQLRLNYPVYLWDEPVGLASQPARLFFPPFIGKFADKTLQNLHILSL